MCISGHDNLAQKVKQSFIGALVPSVAIPSFVSLFKVEKYGDLTLTKRVMCKNKALIVVLSGRVELLVNKVEGERLSTKFQGQSDNIIHRRLNLMTSKKDAICSYDPGDIISFFGCTEFDSNFNTDGSFNFDNDTNITLTAAASDTKIAFINNDDLNTFLESNPKLTSLKSICQVSLSSMLSGLNLYKGVPSKQLDLLSLFMKVSFVVEDSLVNTHPAKELKTKQLRRHSASPQCAMLLQGVLSKVSDQDLESMEPLFTLPPRKTKKNGPKDMFSMTRAVSSVAMSSSRYSSIHVFDESAAQHRSTHEKLNVGYTFGMRALFYKSKVEGFSLSMEPEPDNIYAFSTCIIGELSIPALKSLLGNSNSTFTKHMKLNFTRQAMEAVEDSIPFVAEMPKDKKEKLVKELRLIFFDDGDKLFSEGDPGDALYIIVDGCVQETKNNTTEAFHSTEYVGEMAIMSEDVHRSTAVAIQKTFAIEMTAKSFNDIFNNNSESSEVKIRMAGKRVELQVILDYPQTYALFEKFLKKEHNEENISFYHSVKRYDVMLHLVGDKMTKLASKAVPKSPSSASFSDMSDAAMESHQHASNAATSDLLLSLAHSIRELLDIAQADCATFIDEGSKEQVNVSGTTRLAVMTEIRRIAVCKSAYDELISSDAASVQAVLQAAKPLVEALSRVFDRPKKEIYEVMSKDPFHRWKQTEEVCILHASTHLLVYSAYSF